MAKAQMAEGLAPRLGAAERLQKVLGGAPFSPFTSYEIAEGRDRALANRLVTAALRRHGHLNLIIVELFERGVPPRSGRFEAILRVALAELLFIEGQADHSAIFLGVEAVKRDRRIAHLNKLMNGVLRRAQREAGRLKNLPPPALFPGWLAVRWENAYGAAGLDRFAAALLDGAPLDLTFREDDAALAAELGAEQVIADSYRLLERDKPVNELPGYREGRWWVQDAAAAIPARLFGLPSGARVLDLCAAPGGKTAQLVKAGYNVTALDADAGRLARVRENLNRLGYNANLLAADARDFVADEPFDGVLLDAPCSATGTFRRHPEVIWHREADDIAGRAALQAKMLANAVNCLTPGGVLIYATCSLEPEEGEEQADGFVKSMKNIEYFPVRKDEMEGLNEAVDGKGRMRLHPGLAAPGRAGGMFDGFFIARFRRI